MVIGHYAVGFAAKSQARKVSLPTLFAASVFIDLMAALLWLTQVEHARIVPGITVVMPLDLYDFPISHSLLMVIVWSLLFGGIHWGFKRDRRSAIVLGLCVFSHWVLDLIVHIPDLPLMPGSSVKVGLGLWNSLIGTILVEGGMFVAAIVLYIRQSKAKNRIGSYGLWGLVAVLTLIYVGNLFGPPPPSIIAVAITGQLQWLFVAWGYWIDRNREYGVAAQD